MTPPAAAPAALLPRFAEAIDVEVGAQRAVFEAHARLPWAERVALGVAWPTLRVEERGRSQGRTLLSLRLPGATLHDGIRQGDPVVVCAPDGGGPSARGEVVELYPQVVGVLLLRGEEGPGVGALVGVALGLDLRAYARMKQGMARAARHGGPVLAALLDPQSLPAPPALSRPAPRLPGLNDAQNNAVQVILDDSPLGLIHGPPGTGKTTTLVAGLAALVARGERPWALADSNAAVDHLALCAAAAGLRVARLAKPWRVSPAARPLTVAEQVARSAAGAAIAAIEKEIDRASRAGTPSSALTALHAERRHLSEQATRDTLEGAQVIAMTLGTFLLHGEGLPPARLALVDEATQALEPALYSLVPVVQKLVLIGDPMQLGPVVTGPAAPLSTSVLERLLQAAPVEISARMPMLEVQHRMSAALAALVQPVYGPRYRPHPAVADQHIGERLSGAVPDFVGQGAVFIDTAGAGMTELRDPLSLSLYNLGEARLVAEAARALRAAGLSPGAFAVVAPYSAQVQRLRALPALQGVEVDTINAFQGRETEALIVSFVRSNDDGELGFVADGRRLTVALSRARRLLVLIGDSGTLASHPRFAALLAAIEAQPGALQSVWSPPWDALVDA